MYVLGLIRLVLRFAGSRSVLRCKIWPFRIDPECRAVFLKEQQSVAPIIVISHGIGCNCGDDVYWDEDKR